ncbi:hypothetical protein PN36_08210 [Candidatus Thiomargarita nelsonii]|uniref:Uncharacterized protein n=1 Tax=Candidatus Thiomargarita nelsonii TaxID=1003181 RepID=A0A0A6PFE2_9GAMM|nr:hypothetical protein PN36_08210 [Candidatus Thiomargarita nelsonii]
MQRDLSDDLKQVIFSRLGSSAQLEDWDKASDAELYYELVNGDSSMIHTFKKVVQGREISGGEAFWAVADMADIAFTAVTLGAGALVTSTVKLGAKKVAKSALKQRAKKRLKQNAGKAVAKNASETLLVSFAKKEIFSKMQRLSSSKLRENLSTFNITPTLQFLFKKMNVNRTTLKRINKKWDARLFMHAKRCQSLGASRSQKAHFRCLSVF